MDLIIGLIVFVSFLFIYLLPTYIAHQRNHRGTLSIFLVNLVLGWTLLFWFACLVWSVNSNVESRA